MDDYTCNYFIFLTSNLVIVDVQFRFCKDGLVILSKKTWVFVSCNMKVQFHSELNVK